MSESFNRNNNIDFLKGIFVLLVILTHSKIDNSFYQNIIFPYIVNIAVPGFMFVSGYVRAESFNRKNINNLIDAYNLKLLFNNVLRLLIGFVPIFVLEEIISFINDKGQPLKYYLYTLYMDFIDGGHGPGSYYFPLMVQFVFIFPILYFLIKRFRKSGLISCFVLNVAYELIKYYMGLDGLVYKRLIFRFIFIIAYGIYIGLYKDNINRYVHFLCLLVGICFIFVTQNLDIGIFFINYLSDVSVFACLYFAVILIILVNGKYSNTFIERLGQASYSIFLVQMFYFRYIHIELNDVVLVIVNFVICIGFGLLYYCFESRAYGLVRKIMK